MRHSNFKFLAIAALAVFSFLFAACGNQTTPANTIGGTNPDPEGAAATVNGKTIKMEEVERVIKQQGQGQESKLSPLELAQARLQVLDGLIQQEVMYQKAEKENVLPTDEKITEEFNKLKQQSNLTQEKFDEEMKKAGQTEASIRDSLKKQLAINNLVEKISAKVEQPKDAEVESFFNGNKEAYIKRKGVKLAAIVVDPTNSGEGDTTIDEQSAVLKGNEIIKQIQTGADFAALARESSEDPQSRLQGGDLGYISEEQMRQTFPAQIVSVMMNPQTKIGQIIPTPMQGKFYIFKIQDRSDKDEAQTLETPGVRQDATTRLVEARKQLLRASYQAQAMNEAKIENYLAKQIIDNPNNLSGARPAGSETNTNTNANTSANVNPASNSNTNANAATVNTNTRPTGNTNAARNGNANTKR